MNHDSFSGTTDRLVGAVKNNPEGLLLLAAGFALLLRSGGKKRWSGYPRSRRNHELDDGRRSSRQGRMSSAAGSVREYASDMRDTVTETASGYAEAVSDYAADAGRTIANRSEEIASQAQETFQSTWDSVLERQPLALALAGFAAGAAVAAAFPTTAIERRTLGPTGERLSEAAARTGRQMKTAASAAGDRLMSAADERGLNADGLKEVADDVAGAFDEAMAEGSRSLSSSHGGGNTTSAKPETSGSGGSARAKSGQKS